MRKFIVYTRGDVPSVVEVEGEFITGMEDPTVMWLPEGEFKFRITQPDFLYEPKEIKKLDGSKGTAMTPPVYYSHSCHWTVHRARVMADEMVRHGFELAQRKHGVSFTEEEVAAKIAQVQEVLLP
jgi:hypothetical protein